MRPPNLADRQDINLKTGFPKANMRDIKSKSLESRALGTCPKQRTNSKKAKLCNAVQAICE
jgi:hypothetical protein